MLVANVPPHFRFRHPWRHYQKEILNDFAAHAGDGHFHIVAAPGSGKTVLGLEALRLLEMPAIIFAPTIVVREQWIERLKRDFLGEPPDAPEPAWISRDPAAPGWLTFSTYQGLSAICMKNGQAELHEVLRNAGVRVLVADEAHHLRAFWWKCLAELKADLESPVVIALTATPPYDVPQAEWNRYATFCGEVDAEVTAPELVATGSLCAYQDLVHLSTPLPGEVAAMSEHRFRVGRLFRDFCLDADLSARLYHLPVFAAVDDAALLASLEFHIAAAIYFSETHGKIPPALRNALDLENVTLPAFDLRWFASLLNGLYHGPGETHAESGELDLWKQRLHETGVIHKRRILLEPPEEREKALVRSVRKLNGISEIIESESASLGAGLRAVILCDHIRERDFPSGLGPAAEKPFVRPGVVPAFEAVRRLRLPDVRAGILTGSLMVIPSACRADFIEACATVGADVTRIVLSPLIHDSTFLRLSVGDSDRHPLVGVMTRLFTSGSINTLFGTAALLGEGWDAPAVNTLVIASTVGSYVTSNQMRGRAIRSLHDDPGKTANIWHLATVSDHDQRGQASDFEKLQRRFEAFAGLSAAREDEPPRIEQGLARLGLGIPPLEEEVASINARMFGRGANREGMRHQWSLAVGGDRARRPRPVREVTISSRRFESRFIARLGGTGLFGPIHRWLIVRRIGKITHVVFRALQEHGDISGKCPPKAVECSIENGHCKVGLIGRPAREQAVFSRSMVELFDPFSARPRYLISAGREIYCVPLLLGGSAGTAKRFSTLWGRIVGSHDLHYHHTAPGRRKLVQLSERALLSHQDFAPRVRTRWTC